MVTKIYAFVWILFIAGIGLLFLTGVPSDLTLTIVSFALTTLVFTGLVAVLPWWVDRRFTWEYQNS